ncbi:5'-methylthioadenosine/S-adenosylhomocysteine nucleosidase family protein [Streptosporangium sandarakinum]|uniref:5'-methylthioadenosine/S-adenosylhomocysteine nucleosidase family protein n=1 Tax=Streptosporangium sandarakinum TaxID=1260955 RepID=UPI0036B6374D
MNGNSGIINYGGQTKVSQSAVGHGATVNVPATRKKADKGNARRADVGVITVVPEEARAVRRVLGLERVGNGGSPFSVGTVNVRGMDIHVAAIHALVQGQRSAVMAFENMRRRHHPAVIVFVGIGGGINRDIVIGDVAVATQVIYYDLRKETPEETLRRGDSKPVPAVIGNAVNAFFTDYGEPAAFTSEDDGGTGRDYRVFNGPIGSGDTVIANAESEIIRYLRRFNDKVLAVDMEAGGLTQAFHEQDGPHIVQGWAVIRGISDTAGSDKNDEYHRVAAHHAALTLRELLPYLVIHRG